MLANDSTVFKEEAKYVNRQRIRNKNHLERLSLTKMIFSILAFLFAICSTISAADAKPSSFAKPHRVASQGHGLTQREHCFKSKAGFDSIFIFVSAFCFMESLLGFYGTLKEKRCPMVANFTLSIISCVVLTVLFTSSTQLISYTVDNGQAFRSTALSFVAIFYLCYLILTYISLSLLCYHWNCRCCDQGCCCCTREPDIFEPIILLFDEVGTNLMLLNLNFKSLRKANGRV
uniref:PGG domain-containing protein n=1 Tax=Romanomermis culicivorax TaxID=13658 RepID=A0A915KHG8_ROMCU